MSETYNIGLGNNDFEIRKKANSDFVSFWDEQAKNLFWFSPWKKTLDWQPPFARWFVGGTINASYNALDVHQDDKADKPAILWEGENGESRIITYHDMFIQVQKFSNVLKSLGVKKGDRVTIYLPMVPELPIAMLACARIGAIHTVIFSGFSATSIKDRIDDSKSKVVITADGGYRRGKIVKLKEVVDEAIKDFDFVDHIIVLERTKNKISMTLKDKLWNDLMKDASDSCDAEKLDSNHPLYILYTSGTTGKPKGVLHGTGGYLTHLYSTFKWAFDIKDSDVFFCTADIGWVTGHSYVVYAPLLHGATEIMFEGAPDYPDVSRIWDILQKYEVTIFYTTPTALRMFMKFGDNIPNSFDLSSLRLLGTVGEPINPEVWKWYFKIIGKEKCPIIDTWWQTETGGMLISPLPGLETIPLKPGSGTRPIPGVNITVVDENGTDVSSNTKGYLVIKNPWPGMLLTLWNDDEKYKTVYWSKYENHYYSGDYALKDEDGYFWLLGRADDVLKVAGHRIGTAELESSIVSNNHVAESAVCGIPDELKGEVIIAFVVLKQGVTKSLVDLQKELSDKIRNDIGAIATPKQIYFVTKLPKTRSGKIMRRLLKAIANNEKIGDVSTLEDSTAVTEVQSVFDEIQKSIKENSK
ncbi:acetate--CoA ligase [Marine Group I thaumarchaeote]|jgi:acetyl-CoA synthetase|uniref:Acetate--CoA ligase n=1 Tax=Marine Group I thaumarchaeote TaxID=2511932 RepID=A0A7K4P1P3_9ARCH|nr:MAG: acetate--CoA ligase [Nitrosopumilus sp. YT1]KPU81186.1 3-hydroxypropionyl-CoA synthetase [Nitrosopumilus sp. PRT-SC01]NMI82557.1 acetate--CoA ligase [Candidatus Nitrosopumilus sp. MTA1]NWJ20813.1 acetate--CoA ligase [Marine Group I thaumarchaeote]NWJ57361.1 acetate--CoA ligase [Marine Group I thaumarchaeote]